VFLPRHFLLAAIKGNEHLALKRSHNFLDDMEAIYYVFVWVIMEYDGPNGLRVPRDQRNDALVDIEDPRPQKSYNAKTALLRNASTGGETLPQTAPYFDHPPIKRLFHKFSSIIDKGCADKDTGVVLSEDDRGEFYTNILKHFKTAINSIIEHPIPAEGSQAASDPFLETQQDEEAPVGNAAEAPAVDSGSVGPRAQAPDGKQKQIRKPQPKRAVTVMKSPGRMRPKVNLNSRVQAELGVRDQEEPEERSTGEKRKKQPVVYTGELRRSKRLKAQEADQEA